jgi:hypothetical protein
VLPTKNGLARPRISGNCFRARRVSLRLISAGGTRSSKWCGTPQSSAEGSRADIQALVQSRVSEMIYFRRWPALPLLSCLQPSGRSDTSNPERAGRGGAGSAAGMGTGRKTADDTKLTNFKEGNAISRMTRMNEIYPLDRDPRFIRRIRVIRSFPFRALNCRTQPLRDGEADLR